MKGATFAVLLAVISDGFLTIDAFRNYHEFVQRYAAQRNRGPVENSEGNRDRTDWNRMARKELRQALHSKQNTNVAKNVILFIGDGMAPSTVTASRILKGQLQGRPGEETDLVFERFPSLGLSKTYGADQQVPDSAQTATAMMCGVKTNIGVLGLDDTAVPAQCNSTFQAEKLRCITRWSNVADKSVGLVTSSRITHATPAAGYAYSPYRNWEGDSTMAGVDERCDDIAKQLVMDNKYIKVILGGGRVFFLSNTTEDPQAGLASAAFQRRDGLDLTKVWLQDKLNRGQRAQYVWNKHDFDKVNPECTDYLLGLFNPSHLNYALDNDKEAVGEPTLADLTEKAIQILSRNKNGFFLMVEGARIDHAEHANNAKRVLYETLAFENAVRKAMSMTKQKDTLIVVTADHGHSIKMGGYPGRGNDILGLVEPNYRPALDGKPYTTLSFSTGPGYQYGDRQDLTNVDVTADDYLQASAVPTSSSTHGGEDVAIYARGPMAHLFEGMHEQHYIAHAMAYASCVGPDKRHCRQSKRGNRRKGRRT